jgi:hypothetical protein
MTSAENFGQQFNDFKKPADEYTHVTNVRLGVGDVIQPHPEGSLRKSMLYGPGSKFEGNDEELDKPRAWAYKNVHPKTALLDYAMRAISRNPKAGDKGYLYRVTPVGDVEDRDHSEVSSTKGFRITHVLGPVAKRHLNGGLHYDAQADNFYHDDVRYGGDTND